MLTPTADLSRLTDEQHQIVKKQRAIGRFFLAFAAMLTFLTFYITFQSECRVLEADARAEMAIDEFWARSGIYGPFEDIEIREVQPIFFEICNDWDNNCNGRVDFVEVAGYEEIVWDGPRHGALPTHQMMKDRGPHCHPADFLCIVFQP